MNSISKRLMAMQEPALTQLEGLQGSRCSNRNVRRFNCCLWYNQCLFQATNLRDCTYHAQLLDHNLQRRGK